MIRKKISNLKYTLKLFWVILKLSWKSTFQYKARLVIWFLIGLLQPIAVYVIFSNAVSAGSVGITKDMLVLYVFLLIIFGQIIFNTTLAQFGPKILSGEFSMFLLRPDGYLLQALATYIANVSGKILIGLVPWVMLGVLFWDILQEIIFNIPSGLVLISLIVAIVISFVIHNIIFAIVFFAKKTVGLYNLFSNVLALFSGAYMPIFLMPSGLYVLLEYLPFGYMLSFPLEIAIGFVDSRYQVLQGLAIAMAWLAILLFIYKYTYKLGLSRYESYGS